MRLIISSSGAYEQMDYMLADDNLSWMIFAGSYMNEIKENFNQILASNASSLSILWL